MPKTNPEILELNNVRFSVYDVQPTSRFTNAFGFLKYKTSPQDLANDINHSSSAAVGAALYVVDETYTILFATNKFYLSDFNFALKERAQVINSLSSPIINFFDESVRVYSLQGVAPDTDSMSENRSKNFQHSSLINLYEKSLRGTELVKNNRLAILKVANHTVYGYPLNLNSSYSSSRDKMASFSMNLAVVRHELVIPGVVTTEDLETMVNVSKYIDVLFQTFKKNLKIFLEKSKLATEGGGYNDMTSKEIEELEDLSEVLRDAYGALLSRGTLSVIIEDFGERLQLAVSTIKTVVETKTYDTDTSIIFLSNYKEIEAYYVNIVEGGLNERPVEV